MRRGRSILTAVVAATAALAAGMTGCDAGPSESESDGVPASAYGGQAGMPDSLRFRMDTLDDSQRAILASKPADSLSAAEQAILAHHRAQQGPEQPVPFNHAFHVTDLQLECEYCHTGSRNQAVATMPQMGVCMGCHASVGGGLPAIAQLRAYASAERAVPWIRVYKLPEFVQFSHQPHLRNQIECQECHGPVEEMDRIYQATSLSMGWCLECHRGEPGGADTATTRQLVQRYEIPEIPAGRQSVGLYPRRIEQSYGDTRAPVDCAACHY